VSRSPANAFLLNFGMLTDSCRNKGPNKRQRTDSSSPPLEKPAAVTSSSDEALAANLVQNIPKKIRGAAARNHREKELREQRERERIEAAIKREARSTRRRGDGEIDWFSLLQRSISHETKRDSPQPMLTLSFPRL
jgi:hypothetical protein